MLDVDISEDLIVGTTSIALESVRGVSPVARPARVGEVLSGRRPKGITVHRDENVELMTGLSVRAVNVTVQGVTLPPEPARG